MTFDKDHMKAKDKIKSKIYQSIENLPISGWVKIVAQGKAEQLKSLRTNRTLKKEYFRASK